MLFLVICHSLSMFEPNDDKCINDDFESIYRQTEGVGYKNELTNAVLSSPIPENFDAYSDPLCTGNIKNLWLDVVVVVDKSQLMTNAQLWQVRNVISQVFGAVSTIGPTKYPADPRSTCVGIVTYDSNATTNAQYDEFTSFGDLYNCIQTSLVAVDSTNTSFLSSGLLAAEKALKEGRSRTFRYNFKKVIIAFAADYQGAGTANDVIPVANRIKDNNALIFTVACTTDPTVIEKLSSIASPGYSFVDEMNTSKLVKQLTNALIAANCFCPEDWTQLREDYHNQTSTLYAVCVSGFKATGGSYGYQHAIDWCEYQIQDGYLANEFSQSKHDFLQALMNDTYSYSNSYYIGLRYLNNQWVWEQPGKQPRLPVDPFLSGKEKSVDFQLNLDGYSNWAPGYPQANSTGQVIAEQPWTNGSSTYVWAKEPDFVWTFVCQAEASSTEVYKDYDQF
uniref:VWFA domain-containing protein n=1 Tax=Caenorhabditis tropicalis TaxID=1561998 RepID=A0A1I7TCK1_9PELO